MRKHLFYMATIVLAILSKKMHGQDLKFGMLAGLNAANAFLTDKPELSEDTRVNYPIFTYNINGYLGYKSPSFWGVSAEPGYIQKGGKLQYDKENKDDDVRLQLNYLQLPVLADFYFGEKFFLSIGPEFAYLINAKAKSKDHSNNITEYYDNDFEISGMLGINYSILINLDIGLRYSRGFTYTKQITWTDIDLNPMGESNQYNQYFQFIVRYRIKAGGNKAKAN